MKVLESAKVFAPKTVASMDARAIEEFGIPGLLLMENAALRCFDQIIDFYKPVRKNSLFIILCGRGNNGADGLAMARHFSNHGYGCHCFLFAEYEKLSSEGKRHFDINQEMQIKMSFFKSLEQLAEETNRPDKSKSIIIIDALFGTGFHGTLGSPFSEVAAMIHLKNLPVVSVDIPSGIDGLTGHAARSSFQADLTVTFQVAKQGLYFQEALDACGTIKIVDITIPHSIIENAPTSFELLDKDVIRSQLPCRKQFSYKGSYGKLGIWAGSKLYPGTRRLTTEGAIASGAGLVYLFTEKGIINELPAEVIPRFLDYEDGGTVPAEMNQMDALVVGPGVDFTATGATNLFTTLIKTFKGPILIDASAIRECSVKMLEEKRSSTLILTPHPGEFAHLFGFHLEDLLTDRMEEVTDFCHEHDIHLTLKLPRSLIFSDGYRSLIPFGTPAIAQGGSGDILSGIVGGLLCQQQHRPGDSLRAGSYIHALAGLNLDRQGSGISSLLKFIRKTLYEVRTLKR